MVLATLEWYAEMKDNHIDYGILMDKFCDWLMYGKYTPYGDTFDCGITVRKAIFNFGRGVEPLECGEKSEFSNGNGSLMRILPTALIFKEDLISDISCCAEKIYEMSALTHGHARSKLGCLIYSKIIAEMSHLSSEAKTHIIKQSLNAVAHYLSETECDVTIKMEKEAYRRLFDLDDFINLDESEIRSTGYVVDSLEAAIWCFLTTDNYKECVLKAVNLGEDTDTIGALAGGLAGYYYGIDDIPSSWIELIPKKEMIVGLINSVLG